MNIIESIESKIEALKKDSNTIYTGVAFENRLKEEVQRLENLNKEIENVMMEK